MDIHNKYMLKKLDTDLLIHIYETIAAKHFPPEELKPVSAIKRLLSQNIYSAYGLFQENALIGYAYFVDIPDNPSLLLDYYAILEEYRNQGMGSIFLSKLKSAFYDRSGFFIESEDPAFSADDNDLQTRNKRLAFYERNHAKMTPFLSTLFDVHYRVLYLPCSTQREETRLFTQLDTIYHAMFLEKHYPNILLENPHHTKNDSL